MRLLLPIMITVLGMIIGTIVCGLFKQQPPRYLISGAAGALGAFSAIVVRDVLDIGTDSARGGFLLAVLLGAVVFSVAANLYMAHSRR
jgi:uncharacterized membrane protein YeaQ/YmgE (transglycosylase-associated protein family)